MAHDKGRELIKSDKKEGKNRELLKRGQRESPRHRLLELRKTSLQADTALSGSSALTPAHAAAPGEQIQDRTPLGQWCMASPGTGVWRYQGCTSMWVQVAIRVLFQALPLCLLTSAFAEDAQAVFFMGCFNGHSLRSSCSATDCRSLFFIFFYLFQL